MRDQFKKNVQDPGDGKSDQCVLGIGECKRGESTFDFLRRSDSRKSDESYSMQGDSEEENKDRRDRAGKQKRPLLFVGKPGQDRGGNESECQEEPVIGAEQMRAGGK